MYSNFNRRTHGSASHKTRGGSAIRNTGPSPLVAFFILVLGAPSFAIAERSCVLSVPGGPEPTFVVNLPEVDGNVIAPTHKGLYRYKDNSLQAIPGTEEARSIHKLPPIVFASMSDGGLSVFKDDGLHPIASEEPLGHITDVQKFDNTIFLATESGLFRYHDATVSRVRSDFGRMRAYRVRKAVRDILVTTLDQGLFCYTNGRLRQVAAFSDTGYTGGIYTIRDVTLVTAAAGLFRYSGNCADSRLAQVSQGLKVHRVFDLPSAILVASTTGLFTYDDTYGLRPVPSDLPTGGVEHLYDMGTHLIAPAANGLFRYQGGTLKRIQSNVPTGAARSVGDAGDVVLVSTEGGIFRYLEERLRLVPSPTQEKIMWTQRYGDAILAGTSDGVLRYDDGVLRKVPSEIKVGFVYDITEAPDAVLIAAGGGIFRYISSPASRATAYPERVLLRLGTDDPRTVKLSVHDPCAQALRTDDFRLVLASDTQNRAVALDDELLSEVAPGSLTWSARVSFSEPGSHVVRLALVEGDDLIPISEPVDLRVESETSDLGALATLIAPWLPLMHVLAYGVLLFASRWSRWCWSVVSDPIWGRLGIWSYAALRFIGPLQRWIMVGWLNEMRRSHKPVSYVPLPLTDENEQSFPSTEVAFRLRSATRYWLQGHAGMGKTSVINALEEQVLMGPEARTPRKIFKRFGFIPIVVRLRRFGNVSPDPDALELWIPELARRAVAERGLDFRDAHLFRGILANGGFAVVLDGANEHQASDYLEPAVCASGPIRTLVTSQYLPVQRPESFTVFQLPPTIRSMLRPMLEAFLGKTEGAEVYEYVVRSQTATAIHSGYDVRLLADLIDGGYRINDIPTERTALYSAVLDRIRLPDGSTYPEEELCQAAWEMWLHGERRVIPSRFLPMHLIAPLWLEQNKILRALGDGTFEFRHDQMRGFLAARWAGVHAVSAKFLIAENGGIWRLGRGEQEVVWSFLAALLTPDAGAELWRWATQAPERAVLQNAIQQRAANDGWSLSLTPQATA